jgi:hypothetical protein
MRFLRRCCLFAVTTLVSICGVASATTATTTTLFITASGSPATSVPLGTPVTLIATVTASSGIPRGRVNFCNADVPNCTGTHLLGSGEVTPGGTASLVVRPMPATRHYRAIFVGNLSFGASSSGVTPIAVTGQLPTTTTFAATGSVGNYTLTSTVTASTPGAPSGVVEFQDTGAGNAQVAHALPGAATPSIAFSELPALTFSADLVSTQPVDFNNDGFQDVLFTDLGFQAGVFLSDGHGGFTPGLALDGIDPNIGQTLFPRGSLTGVASADFDRDGKPDLTAIGANYEDDPIYRVPVLLVQLANGSSTVRLPLPFTGFPQVPLNGLPITGDFNGDGNQDILVVGFDYQLSQTLFVLMAGHGDGTFTSSGVLNNLTQPGNISVSAADVNSDGLIDLLLIPEGGPLTVLLNQGGGAFLPRPTSIQSSTPTVADWNNDGKPDLVYNTMDGLAISLGNGDGTFQPQLVIGKGPQFLEGLQAADVDGDGNLDLLANSFSDSTIYLGHGNGSFSAGVDIFLEDPVDEMNLETAIDIDGDGRVDFVAQSSSPTGAPTDLHSFLNVSTETATAQASGVSIPGAGAHPIAAHFDGDSVNAPSGSGTILLNAGSRGVDQTSTLVTLSAGSIAFGSSLTVTATVRDTTNPARVPAGKVAFYDQSTNNTLIAFVSLTGGQAGFVYAPPTVGQHHIVAGFNPSDATQFSASADNFGKTVTREPMPTSIAFSVPQHTFGDPAFFLTATSNSPAQITYTIVSGRAQIFGQRLLLTGAGTVVVRASQVAQGSFGAAATEASFSVSKAQQILTFPPPPSMVTVGANPIPLHATSSSNNVASPMVQSGPAFIIFGGPDNLLQVTAPGIVVVTAQLPETADYYASRKITYSIQVNPAPAH